MNKLVLSGAALIGFALAAIGGCGGDGDSGPGSGGASSESGGGGPGNGPGGGSSSDGGSSPTSSGPSGGGGGGSVIDPEEAAKRVDEWMAQLPYGQQDLTPDERAQVIDAILKSCAAFGPPGADWQKYCQAILVGAILKESSYNHESIVNDLYAMRDTDAGAANDPTIGLLQIRFSSTVNDYTTYGRIDALEGIGCTFPDFSAHAGESGDSEFWAVTGPTANLAFMQSIPCNVGLATWYYFMNATGNGGAGPQEKDPVYAYQYCQGDGVAGNVVIGLLSHLLGPGDALEKFDPNNEYVVFIKDWFETFVGVVSPDPFTVTLSPNVDRYCR